MDPDGRGTHFTEACDEAAVLIRLGVAQELECDVPGFGRHPAQAVAAWPEACHNGREFGEDCGGQRDGNEQTHTQIV